MKEELKTNENDEKLENTENDTLKDDRNIS